MANRTAKTNGWDTVYGIPLSAVNKVIASSHASPTSFSAEGTDGASRDKYTISGTFSDWKIVPGGAGNLLHMETPAPTMTLSAPRANKTFHFTDGQFVVEVNLQYLPSTHTPLAQSTGHFQDLKLKSAVRMVSSSFSGDDYTQALKSLTEVAVLKWYNSHIGAFNHTFVTVNLNRTADQGAFEWLLPTSTNYAYIDYTDSEGIATGVLGILCMTGGRSAAGRDQQVSPNIIPQGSQAGFLIAQERFMQDLLLPAMPQAFKGTTANDYQLSPNLTSITLTNKDVQIDQVQEQGKSYSPFLESLTISVFGDTQIQIETLTKTNILDQICSMGSANNDLYPNQHSSSESVAIWSWCHTTSNFTVGLYPVKNNAQSLQFNQVGKPVVEHWTTKSEGMFIVQILLGIVAAVLTLVVGILTGGAGFVAGALVIGLLAGLITQTLPQLIALIGTDDAPSIDLLVLNATDPIQWPSQTHFNPNFAALNESLQLGGNPS